MKKTKPHTKRLLIIDDENYGINEMDVVNKEVLNYINEFYGNSSNDLEEFRLSCENEHIPIIKRDSEAFLNLILSLYKPERILDIGTGVGYSSVVFASVINNCQITTIELIDKRINAAKLNFEKYGISDRVKLIEGDASESLKTMIKDKDSFSESELFDFVFIDCAKSRYKEFFTDALLVTKTDGMIVCDNVLLDGRTVSDEFILKHRDRTSTFKMRMFMDLLKHKEGEIKTALFNIGDGLTVSRLG